MLEQIPASNGSPCTMPSRALREVFVLSALLACQPWVCAQGTPASAVPKQAHATAEKPKKAPTSIESLKTPAGAIVVICNQAADAFRLVPQGVLLAPEAYQHLLEQIEQLKSKLQTAARTPAVCTLSGRVTGDVIQLEAEFEFTTTQPRSLMNLGCQRASPTSAALDGQLPVLTSGDDGLVVQVEKPGVHRLVLGLEAPWSPRVNRAGERGFDIGLPRAAITRLRKFEVAGDVPLIQVNGRAVQTRPGKAGQREVGTVLLGAAERLDISWKAPAVASAQDGKQPLMAADAVVAVRIDENQVTTDAELTLRVLRGKVSRWQVRVPFDTHADLKMSDDRTRLIQPADPRNPLVTIEREPSAEPVVVHLRSRQPRHGAAVVPGPWYLLGALRQQGTIAITAAPELRVQVHPQGDVLAQEVVDSKRSDAVASFSYWSLPRPPQAPLTLEIGTLKGWLTTHTSHTLRFNPDSGWQLTTLIKVDPVRIGVDHVDVLVPAGLQLQEGVEVTPPDALAGNPPEARKEKTDQVLTIPLVRRQRSPFTITLTGTYPLHHSERHAEFLLPRPRGTQDRGGRLQVELPPGQELVPPEGQADAWPPGTREHTWRNERAPVRAVLSWRSYRPPLTAAIETHVTLLAGRAWVRELVRFPTATPWPRRLYLTVPAELRGHVDATLDQRPLELTADGLVSGTGDKTAGRVLTLSYSFSLPNFNIHSARQEGRRFTVPLVRPREASRLNTRVFFYTEPGVQLEADSSAWDEGRLEATSDATLPTLVLQTRRLQAPLMVHETSTGAASLAGLFVERALIQVAVDGAGGQAYRARFVTGRPGLRQLEIELPGPAASLNTQVFIHGKEVRRFLPSSDDRRLRLNLPPDLIRESGVIEVRYQLDSSAVHRGPFQTTLQPPILRGQVLVGPLRWEVSLPPGWTPLFDGGYGAEQTWEWHGLLWIPRPIASTDELEQWLHAPIDATPTVPSLDVRQPAVVCWGQPDANLGIWHVPQAAWLLACSVVFLALGLGLIYLPLSRTVLVSTLMLLGLALAAAALRWPGALPLALFGCEPGAVALGVLVMGQWLLQRRYQRQVTIMPAFSRLKAGSSLVRTLRPSIPHGEPSTVDVPPLGAPSEPLVEPLPRMESSSQK